MKGFILSFITLLYFNVHAQTYSSTLKDHEIFSFMDGQLKSKTLKHPRSIDSHVISWDSSILRDSTLNKFFTGADISFLVKQIKNIKKDKWEHKFPAARLIREIPDGSTQSTAIFSYSIPLLSVDKKKALVIEGFYCGLLCGGGAYYIFELQIDGSWKRIKKFKEWAE